MRATFGLALLATTLATACPAGAAPTGPVTTINGAVPPGVMLPEADMSTMLDTLDADGNRLVVWQGVRKAGTRTAIHFHGFGGHTCVLSGTITDFVEGHEPMTFPAGACYYMPPDTPMAAANLGTDDARLIDTFVLPPWAAPMTVLEPGWPETPMAAGT